MTLSFSWLGERDETGSASQACAAVNWPKLIASQLVPVVGLQG